MPRRLEVLDELAGLLQDLAVRVRVRLGRPAAADREHDHSSNGGALKSAFGAFKSATGKGGEQ